MSLTLHFALLGAALVCFAAAALGATGRLIPIGLGCWLLATTFAA